MKKSTKTGLAVAGGAGVAGILIALLWPREAKADDKRQDVRPTPPRPDFVASDTVCFRDNQPYNAAQLGQPEQVVSALRRLGFAIGLVELLQSDAAAPRSPVWPASTGYTPATSVKLKSFQASARSLGLDGYKDSPASAIDGVWGECTARSVSHALRMQEAGTWPYQPIAGISP